VVLAVLLLTALLVVIDGRADDATADASEAGARLVALSLPADVDPAGCVIQSPADGELRRLSCPSDSQPEGVPTGRYTALDGAGAAEEFAAHVEANDLPQLEEPSDCGSTDTPQGWAEVTDTDDRVLGRMSCAVDGDGDAELRWVWDDLGTLGFVEQRGGGEDGLSSLQSWWSSEADRS
jgi:serine/threonine-protein kinase